MKKKILNIVLILLIGFVFIDIVGAETYNNYDAGAALRSCGGGMITKIPPIIPKVISVIYSIIQVAVPIVLVIMGSLDLFKGITAGKEDEIKKGQTMFIKRLIAAVIIFLVFIIVKFVIGFVEQEKSIDILDCVECFIDNNCD